MVFHRFLHVPELAVAECDLAADNQSLVRRSHSKSGHQTSNTNGSPPSTFERSVQVGVLRKCPARIFQQLFGGLGHVASRAATLSIGRSLLRSTEVHAPRALHCQLCLRALATARSCCLGEMLLVVYSKPMRARSLIRQAAHVPARRWNILERTSGTRLINTFIPD